MRHAISIGTPNRHRRCLLSFQPFDLTWLEEPTVPDDVPRHRRMLAQGGVPIAARENLRTLWEFKNYIVSDAVSYPDADVTNCGGVTSFMKIARLAKSGDQPRRS
jgi:L-alanine-DL-glutamate epimerase-like enolase superfamily enzyme